MGWKNMFSASPGKAMQNHLEISSRSQFWIRNVEIGGKHKETISFSNVLLRKNVIFCLQTTFFDGFKVLVSFLTEKWCRTIYKFLQKTNFEFKTCKIEPKLWFCMQFPFSFFFGPQPGLGPHPDLAQKVCKLTNKKHK